MGSSQVALSEQVQVFLRKYGQSGFQVAKTAVLVDKIVSKPIREILCYFMEETWLNIQHPALIALACQAVGGRPDAPNQVSAAIVLLTGAADIHDDIIDKSKTKASKPTPYGKFSQDAVLLAGDALLFKGLMHLHKACDEFSVEKKQVVLGLVQDAFFEIGNATANERTLKGKHAVEPEKYRKIIEAKGAVSDACARIGAVIGEGAPEEIDVLGHFGRTLGILMGVKYDFVDLFNPAELQNRAKNEVLPLPLLYALQDTAAKKQVETLLKGRLTKQKTRKIADLALKTNQVQILKKEMLTMARNEANLLKTIKGNTSELKLLLKLSIEHF